ncbi:MAG: SDR family NAD(P)-dependent oxidoreductase [Gemmatimonas sp.]|nr:SDR family NAD(P)-dependent oxidoreductase [Gemmatimonas sp.]
MRNRTVFITGASSGIGEACANAFAAASARLLLAARRMDRLDEVASRLRTEYDVEVHTIELDVRDVGVVSRVLAELPREWSEIDVLVNNAGLARGFGPVPEGDTRDWDEMMDTNVKGLLYVTRAVLPAMLARDRGHVINISSIAGDEVYPNGVAYCASKAAVDAISYGLRMDIAGSSVRVTNIKPGMVETEFSEVRFHGDRDRAAKVYAGVTPLSAADVADTVFYAASRPPHVNIDEIKLKPVAQATATMVARDSG